MNFIKEPNRIYLQNETGKIIAEITKKKFINKATENLKPCMYEKYPIDGFCHGVKVED